MMDNQRHGCSKVEDKKNSSVELCTYLLGKKVGEVIETDPMGVRVYNYVNGVKEGLSTLTPCSSLDESDQYFVISEYKNDKQDGLSLGINGDKTVMLYEEYINGEKIAMKMFKPN